MKAAYALAVALFLVACGCGDSNPYVTRARLRLENLDNAMKAYQADNGDWPADLKELTQQIPAGGEPYLSADSLVDPWGRPYQYDRNNVHLETQLPLIWSEGPNPGSPGSKIANWSEYARHK